MAFFTKKQQEFWLNANRRWNVKTGATRSGKTYMDYFVIPKRIREADPTGEIVILGHTQSTAERNVIEPMRRMWGDKLVGSISSSNKINMFGRQAYVLGADKKNQVEKIQGMGISYCYGDEVTTWSQNVFEMLKSRLDRPTSTFDGTCNPEGPNHWFKEFLDSDADIYQLPFTIYDNTYLAERFVKELEKEYAGTVYFERYILGLWVKAEGLIYSMFSKEKHVVRTVPRKYEEYHVSIDYGTNNPTTFGLWGLWQGRWYKIKEYYHKGADGKGDIFFGQKTDAEYADDLAKFVGLIDVKSIIIDPSAASFALVLKRRGWRIRLADNNVLDGIRFVSSMLNFGILQYNDCCEQTFEEFELYSWDDTVKDEDRPIQKDDHCMDSDRYFVNTVILGTRKHREHALKVISGKIHDMIEEDEKMDSRSERRDGIRR